MERLLECQRQRDCLGSQLQAVESYVEALHREVKSLRQAKRENIDLTERVRTLERTNRRLVCQNQKLVYWTCVQDKKLVDVWNEANPSEASPRGCGPWSYMEIESVLSSPISEPLESCDARESASTQCTNAGPTTNLLEYRAILLLLHHERREKEKLEGYIREFISKMDAADMNKHKIKFGNAQLFDFSS